MLQNIQAELYAHRSIMLDIQSRVSHLEKSRPVSGISSCTGTDMRARERERLDAHNKLIAIAPEGQAWWEACQNFARNSNPPISAGEFLRTPVPVSAFEPAWNNRFSGHMSILETPPITPPEQKSSVQIVVDEVATTPTEKTKTVEIEVKELPPPPPLRPAPRPGSDSPSVETTDFAGATSTKKAESEQTRPAKKRKRSLATFEARFKHNKLDKGKSSPRLCLCPPF